MFRDPAGGSRAPIPAVSGAAACLLVVALGDSCHCDDPGLEGALIGAPIGAALGGIAGGKWLFSVALPVKSRPRDSCRISTGPRR